MEKRDKMGKALHIRGLRQRWMVNSVAPVCVLLILVVILVAAPLLVKEFKRLNPAGFSRKTRKEAV